MAGPMKYKIKKLSKRDMPEEFTEDIKDTIQRIESAHTVLGVVYFRRDVIEMCTFNEITSLTLSNKLPPLSACFQRAVCEMDVQDELLAYRMVTKNSEILVVPDKEFTVCAIHSLRKKKKPALEKKKPRF